MVHSIARNQVVSCIFTFWEIKSCSVRRLCFCVTHFRRTVCVDVRARVCVVWSSASCALPSACARVRVLTRAVRLSCDAYDAQAKHVCCSQLRTQTRLHFTASPILCIRHERLCLIGGGGGVQGVRRFLRIAEMG